MFFVKNSEAIRTYTFDNNYSTQTVDKNTHFDFSKLSKYSSNTNHTLDMPIPDAIAMLNKMNSKDKKTKEQQKKEQAIEKATKLSEKIAKAELILNDKHVAALQIINKSELSKYGEVLGEKIRILLNNKGALAQKVMQMISNSGNSNPKEIVAMTKSLTSEFESLKNDWIKTTFGIRKAGAFTEAMLKVDDPEKKDKYKEKVSIIVNSLPSPEEIQVENNESGQVDDIDEDNEESTSIDVATNENSQIDEQIEETQTNTDSLEETQNEDEDNSETERVEEKEEDEDLKTLKKEVKEELKKQKSRPKPMTFALAELYATKSIIFDDNG